MAETDKKRVHDFWEEAACGEALYLDESDTAGYRAQMSERYALEPFILPFARFEEAKNKDVLEIGVGLGADHQMLAQSGARLHGIDLTERAVEHTKKRLSLFNLSSEIKTGDAENLSFPDESFDIVYSWGVLHHSPDTPKAISEVHRVLRKGGTTRIMIYHTWSLVGFMLWIRYALMRGRIFTPLSEIYDKYLESPGTKAYTIGEAKKLFEAFSRVEIKTVLTHGDLLSSGVGQRHRGGLLKIARLIWPRWLLRTLFSRNGLYMLITATK